MNREAKIKVSLSQLSIGMRVHLHCRDQIDDCVIEELVPEDDYPIKLDVGGAFTADGYWCVENENDFFITIVDDRNNN
jgi:hypothetical protein